MIGVCEGTECGTSITRSGVICLELCVGFNLPLFGECLFCCVRPADSALFYDADRGHFSMVVSDMWHFV